MDWNSFDVSDTSMNYATGPHISTAPLMPVHYPHPSPIQLLQVRNRPIYVKRDDLLRLSHSNNISGNKARKLLSLSLLPRKFLFVFPKIFVSPLWRLFVYGACMQTSVIVQDVYRKRDYSKINPSY
jgi:hypothetical protein